MLALLLVLEGIILEEDPDRDIAITIDLTGPVMPPVGVVLLVMPANGSFDKSDIAVGLEAFDVARDVFCDDKGTCTDGGQGAESKEEE